MAFKMASINFNSEQEQEQEQAQHYKRKKISHDLSDTEDEIVTPNLACEGFCLIDSDDDNPVKRSQPKIIRARLHHKNGSIGDLKRAGVSLLQLKLAGRAVKELKEEFSLRDLLTEDEKSNGELLFSLGDLQQGGFDIPTLREAGVKANQWKAAGYSVRELQSTYSLTELAGCRVVKFQGEQSSYGFFTTRELLDAGYDLRSLKEIRVGPAKMKADGCSFDFLREEFSLKDLASCFTARECIAAGCDIYSLREAGFSVEQMKDAGVPVADLIGIYLITEILGVRLGVRDCELPPRHSPVFTVNELSAAGLNFDACLQSVKAEYGLTANHLKSAGYTSTEISGVYYLPGFDEGFLVALKNSGATVALLRNSGCSLSNLLQIFSLSELIGIGVKEARLGDYFSVQELLRIGIETTALINAGVKCIDMRDAGKTAKDLTGMYAERELGETFSAEELVEAGFKAEDLVKANFPLARIRQCGFGVKTLYSSEAIQNKRLLGLFLLGTHPNSGAPYLTKFRGSSQSIVKRKVADFLVGAEKGFGRLFLPTDILSQLSVPELREDGITDFELENDYGCSKATLAAATGLHAGETVRECVRFRNCSNLDCLLAGYPLTEFSRRDHQVLLKLLLNMGFTAKNCANKGFTFKQLIDAGVSLAKLRLASFDMSYFVRAFQHRQVYFLQLAGFRNEEILNFCASSNSSMSDFSDDLIELGIFSDECANCEARGYVFDPVKCCRCEGKGGFVVQDQEDDEIKNVTAEPVVRLLRC